MARIVRKHAGDPLVSLGELPAAGLDDLERGADLLGERGVFGVIRYAATRPADFWAERGYDWYAGH